MPVRRLPPYIPSTATRDGFTLIELLVVIAIIMILGSILFPTFARARATARATVCASNLRQCGIAIRMYMDDYDDKFPPQDLKKFSGMTSTPPRSITGPAEAIWFGQIFPYLKTTQVMICTSASAAAMDKLNGYPIGLGLNISLAPHSDPSSGDWYNPAANAGASSTTAMVMADCPALVFEQTPDGMMDVAYANAPSKTYSAGQLGSDQESRHPNGSNVLFLDGHVKCYGPTRLLAEIPPLN